MLRRIFDKRRFLIVVEVLYTALCVVYAAIVGFDLATPNNLLLFTFLIGAAGALTVPAWQSVVPQLVPKEELTSAVAANSVGVNASRAIGPALGGAAIAALGIVSPFWINAISNLGVIGALLWWERPNSSNAVLPAERLGGAIEAGLRYTRYSPALRVARREEQAIAAGAALRRGATWTTPSELPDDTRIADFLRNSADVMGLGIGSS